ncbi:MAG: tripartite tricarboxylate transporter TctB family protein [Candidatus Binatia bacterium]
MKIGLNLRFFLALTAAVAGGYTLYVSMDWPLKTALFPRVIGLPILLLAVIEIALSLFGIEQKRTGHAVDFELTTDVDPAIVRQRTRAIAAWILGFFGMILLFGFPLAVPLFVFLYLKVAGKEGWLLTLSLTTISWLMMEGFFNRLLHLPFAQGWIFGLLN